MAIDRTARIVAGRRAQGVLPIVVVSAMAKVTDQLIAAANAAGRGDRAGALAISARLRHRHHDTARKLLTQAPNFSDTPSFCEMSEWIDKKFESLDEIFRGLAAVGELTARTGDLVVSFGEQLSSRMVTAGFRSARPGRRSCGREEVHRHRRATWPGHPQRCPDREAAGGGCVPLLREEKLPVMGGFIGSTEDGVTTTLGRGGSDFTAALVGGGLNASVIEIWTDVERHHDRRSAHLSRCPAGEDDQL